MLCKGCIFPLMDACYFLCLTGSKSYNNSFDILDLVKVTKAVL